jgi:asparagine synthase (glutamine-hydrolysing)
MSALEPGDISEFLGDACDPEEIFSEAIEAWDRCKQPGLVEKSLQWWTDIYLRDDILAKVDRASMLCSLEARSPFLDLEVVNLARRIPSSLKFRDGQTKWILKKAVRGIIPDSIIDRPKKGFGMPIGGWLREGKFDFAMPTRATGGDPAFLSKKLDSHLTGKSDERLFLWCQWVFENWMKNSGAK